jgi:hypothetical protein
MQPAESRLTNFQTKISQFNIIKNIQSMTIVFKYKTALFAFYATTTNQRVFFSH